MKRFSSVSLPHSRLLVHFYFSDSNIQPNSRTTIIMVRYIEGTIDYEKRNEVLNDNHKVLIYLDDMTLTGK